MNPYIDLLTQSHLKKQKFSNHKYNLNFVNLNKLTDDLIKCINIPFKFTQSNSSNVRKELLEFDDELNERTLLYEKINSMKLQTTFIIETSGGNITLNILCDGTDSDHSLIVAIIYAIHMFCEYFKYNYEGLNIYASLDPYKRTIDYSPNITGIDQIIDYLRVSSSGFTVSGMTQRRSKKIVLTKSEEIIKLLFHEMIHFVGLDQYLLSLDYHKKWSVASSKMNMSEAYAESLSVVLHSAYIAIGIATCSQTPSTPSTPSTPTIPTKTTVRSLFNEIMNREIDYSILLSSTILQFYGYNHQTVSKFFDGSDSKRHRCRIAIWEYVMIRTQILMNVDQTIGKLYPSFYVTQYNCDEFIRNISSDKQLLDDILDVEKYPDNKSISYLFYDVDWKKILR